MDVQRVAIHGASTDKDAGVDPQGALQVSLQGFQIPNFDYVGLSYTGDNLTTVTYKSGGSSGTTVATLTLAYSGSTLTSITKS